MHILLTQSNLLSALYICTVFLYWNVCQKVGTINLGIRIIYMNNLFGRIYGENISSYAQILKYNFMLSVYSLV